MRGRRDLAVVKLGGSAAFSPDLKKWLDTIARCGGHIVVVPGGGPFADTVRAAQPKIGFDNRAAHHMAVLAMEQFACAIASLNSRLIPAASLAAIRRVLKEGGAPVWLPARMVLAARDIPWSWDVTSDSLAVWLAGKLGAKRAMMVKHVAPAKSMVCVKDMVAQEIVDPAVARFIRSSGVAAFILGQKDYKAAEAAICNGSPIGARIVLN